MCLVARLRERVSLAVQAGGSRPDSDKESTRFLPLLSTGIRYSLNSQASDPFAFEPIELFIASTMMRRASILSCRTASQCL